MPPSTVPILLSDLPEQDDTALWSGVTTLAGRLVSLLQTWARSSGSPLLVTGDWGSGKTTLLRAMERRLRALNEVRSPVIWFDAWRHEGEGALLPALVRAIWDQLPAEVRDQSEAQALLASATRTALQMGARAVGALATAAGLGLVAGLTKAAVDGAKAGEATHSPAPPKDPSATLVAQLHRMLAMGWPADKGVEAANPIVFIDDLDRCSPDGALALLDQVRALLAATEGHPVPIRFVMAMDRDVLLKAVASKYRDIDRYDANRFLEKMFPLAFSVPAPPRAEVSRLVTGFLRADPTHPVLHAHEGALVTALAPGFFANPRLMKRCVNRFRLVTWFENDAGTTPHGDAADRVLASWIAATERWPDLRRVLRDHDDAYWRAIQAAMKPPAVLPGPDAEQLLRNRGVKEWMRTELFGDSRRGTPAFRAAETRLQRWGL